jgi:hypothetical protein
MIQTVEKDLKDLDGDQRPWSSDEPIRDVSFSLDAMSL